MSTPYSVPEPVEGTLPSGWARVRLGEIVELKYGKSLAAAERSAGPFPVFGSNGQVGTHTSAITTGPTIVVGRKGSLGAVNYSEEPCWPIDTTYYVDRTATAADLRWLAYRMADLGLTTMNRAAAVPGLNREDAYRLAVLLPPLSEQRRIAAILDAADALRAKRRATIAALDTLTQSIFLDMFGDPASNPKGWPLGRIGDIVDSAQYGTSAKAGADGDFAVLRMNNLTRTGEIDLTDLKYMDLSPADMRKYLVEPGDILFNRTNSPELVGKSAIVRADVKMAFAGYLIRVRTSKAHDPEYLAAFLNTRYAKAVLRSMCKSIIGMANINAQELRGIEIPLPPGELQRSFATAVAGAELAKVSPRQSLSGLDALFQSLQSRAFRGEL